MAVAATGLDRFRNWFASRGWRPWAFQEETWAAYLRGESGLINVPTGAGKTYAAYGGPLAELIDEVGGAGRRAIAAGRSLRVLYVTPLRAVSRDIEQALKAPVADLCDGVSVESRTGDTSASVRARQRVRLPHVLITTPESLCLLLTQPHARELFADLRCAILDEWHELMSSKRGTQVELAMARLRRWRPRMRTWALSATLANLGDAARAACGSVGGTALPGGEQSEVTPSGSPVPRRPVPPTVIRARIDRPIYVETLIPEKIDSFPWAGFMGLSMARQLVGVLDPARSTLIFTNTRSQAELWFQAIRHHRPEWAPVMGLHHGSIERAEREKIEAGLKSGTVRLVVCTSSLDLGVDFAPVERVVQIGSPKGVARLIQRAGRSGHRPGAACSILCVPTHGLELLEVDAARRAIESGEIEPRLPASKPLDVLAQHLVTCALGGGFEPDDLFEEVRAAWSYRDLTRQEFEWSISLVREGGGTLAAYPQFRRIALENGKYIVPDRKMGTMHRLNVGTITGDAVVDLRFMSGRRLGSIEEWFVSNLRAGETFVFAGRVLEFIALHDMTAYARPARKRTNYTPHWGGTRLPISEALADSMRRTLELSGKEGSASSPEIEAARPIIEAQRRLSRIPAHDEILAETCVTREGHHLFLFPFEGRLVHGGLAALFTLRLTRRASATISFSANDYGLELLSPEPFDFGAALTPELFSGERLAEDALASANISELAKRQFREIARVSGLVWQTYPGARKTGRQLQASSSLIYDVFAEFDPANPLLEQARREVLERHFESSRLTRTLERLRTSRIVLVPARRPTPLAFPLIVERVSALVSSRTLLQRIEAMKEAWTREDSRSR